MLTQALAAAREALAQRSRANDTATNATDVPAETCTMVSEDTPTWAQQQADELRASRQNLFMIDLPPET